MDHDKPKRPMNSYFKWRVENYPALKSKNPDANVKEMRRVVAKAWEEFPEKEKKRMEDEFKKENDKWSVLMEKWKKDHGTDDDDKPKNRKKSASHSSKDEAESGKKMKNKSSESGKKKTKENADKKQDNAPKGNKKK
jgi:hypothetical protein